MNAGRLEKIRQRLEEALQPVDLTIKDQSHLHVGHAGAQDGKGHFEVQIVAARFDGKSRLQRHRLVYDALGDLMETDVHALKIRARTPEED